MKRPIIKLYARKLNVVEHGEIVHFCESDKGLYIDEEEEKNVKEEFVEELRGVNGSHQYKEKEEEIRVAEKRKKFTLIVNLDKVSTLIKKVMKERYVEDLNGRYEE